jgi:outer membrane biosynthesis protein TonB
MGKAVFLSLLLHAILIAGLVWSDKLYTEYIKATQKEIHSLSATLLIDRSYKPTDTAMKKGSSDRNLPPPKITVPKTEDTSDSHHKLKDSKASTKGKKKLKDILSKIRKEASEEKRPPPKEKNFPTHERGEKGAHGTGGWSERTLTPSEQALQSAFRKYFELEGATTFRKNFPNARGYLQVKLIATGNQFKIVSLVISESTGFNILDRNCEAAIRKACDQETFAKDVVAELTGKETIVTCKP